MNRSIHRYEYDERERQRRLNHSTFTDSLPTDSTSEGRIDSMTGCGRSEIEADAPRSFICTDVSGDRGNQVILLIIRCDYTFASRVADPCCANVIYNMGPCFPIGIPGATRTIGIFWCWSDIKGYIQGDYNPVNQLIEIGGLWFFLETFGGKKRRAESSFQFCILLICSDVHLLFKVIACHGWQAM